MARRNQGESVHGWLVVDKSSDITSAKVVSKARKILNAKKVGHSGTLDPFATGVLPLAFGEATKTVSFMMGAEKKYQFTIRWGATTDTDDLQGLVIRTSDIRPSREEIEAALPKFIGNIQQSPPAFSAVKLDGERAYKLARSGKSINLKPRPIFVKTFKLIEVIDLHNATFEVISGKGAYIRGLARDLAHYLGTSGHVSQLRRTLVGPFSERDAISLDQLVELGHKGAAADRMRPVEAALDGIPALILTVDEAHRLRCGQYISSLQVARRLPVGGIAQGEVFCAKTDHEMVALVKLEGNQIRPVRVINF